MESSKVPAKRRAFGARIERLAERWLLESSGADFRLLARNYFARGGELDLVCEERFPSGRVELVFIEVRARPSRRDWHGALESVSLVKRRRTEKAARRYLMHYRGRATSIRFDVIGWEGRGFFHCRDAWRPGG